MNLVCLFCRTTLRSSGLRVSLARSATRHRAPGCYSQKSRAGSSTGANDARTHRKIAEAFTRFALFRPAPYQFV
ncbi:Uncharacterised protein [Klebsiella pneumoniae]|uniref:Uncharacterized protein n=1 Tax=Klebsiella pneumoniae TaxID=573 RepID=A0A377WSZ8_KLEPN|nr:Uncharacterised protein [Klebsiella pneumoniae]